MLASFQPHEAQHFGEYGGVDVFAQHDFVVQVEARRFDAPTEHTRGIFEEVAIMVAAPTIGVDDGHAVATTGPARTLLVVRRLRWRVTHQDHIQRAYIYAHL